MKEMNKKNTGNELFKATNLKRHLKSIAFDWKIKLMVAVKNWQRFNRNAFKFLKQLLDYTKKCIIMLWDIEFIQLLTLFMMAIATFYVFTVLFILIEETRLY